MTTPARLSLPLWLLVLSPWAAGGVGAAQEEPVPTFTADIAPLMYRNCSRCHHEGGSGPFPLIRYQDVRKRAKQIAIVTESRYMPPWKPEPGHGEFRGRTRLNDDQIGLLRRWADGGAPFGDAAELPDPPTYDRRWFLGEPDLVLTMDEAYELPAEEFGKDSFRAFVLPSGFETDRYVRALDFQPDNPRVLHHLIVLLDREGKARLKKPDDGRIGFEGMVAENELYGEEVDTWLPGNAPSFLPEGAAWLVPAGSNFVLDCHFNATGKPERVALSVAVYFAEDGPTASVAPVANVSIAAGLINVPPGDTDYRVQSTFEIPVDLDVLSILPHAHYVGKQIWIRARFPDGRVESMIRIDDWDFNWQDSYTYVEPLHLPRGTLVDLLFTYDNSLANPRNPFAPPRRILSGPRSTDEMALLWMQVMPRRPEDIGPLKAAVRADHDALLAAGAREGAAWAGFVGLFDRDGDGYLSVDEDAEATAFVRRLGADRSAYDLDGDGRVDEEEERVFARIVSGWIGEEAPGPKAGR